MEPGYMALSIYCVHMSSKWSRTLDSRPIQGKDMSVEIYYDQFCIWKKKLEEVNYIGEEESYIDDFLYGLKMDLAVRVWVYKWKPRTLYGAFRRAEMEETMLSWKELSRKNDVDKVFEEMSQPNSINNADTIEAEVVSDEDNYSVVDASGNMATHEGFSCMLDTKQLQALGTVIDGDRVLGGMFKPAYAPEAIFISPKARNHLLDEVGQLHSLKLEGLRDTQQLFDAMPSPISIKHNDENDSLENLVLPTMGLLKILSYGEAAPEFHSTKLEGLKNAENVFDKMLQQFLAKQKNGINGHEKWEPSMSDFPRDLGSKADKMKVGSTNSPSKMMFGEMGVFMFDPGISSWHRRGCGCIKSNGVKHDFDKMPGNSNAELWFGKMLLFVFDPGGSSLFPTGCNSFLFTDDNQHFDKFSGTYWQRFTSTFTFFIKECVKQGHVLKMGYDVDDFFVDYSLDSKVLCKRNVVRSSSGKPFTPFSRVVPILELVVRTENRNMVMALFEEGFKRIYCDMNSFGGNSNVKSTRESGSERLLYEGLRIHHTVIRMGWSGSDPFMANALVDFYSTHGDVEGWKAFFVIPSNGVILWSFMVSVCDAKGLMCDIVAVPYSMQLWGDKPSSSLFLVILCFSCSTYHFQFGEKVQCCIIVVDAIRILEYFGEYMHGRYSVRSKLGWGQFSTIWLVWYTKIAEYIAWELKKEAEHYTNGTMEMHSVVVKCIFKKLEAWDIYMLKQRICFYPFGILCQCNEFCKTSGAQELKAIASRDFYAKWIPAFFLSHHLEDKAVVEGMDLSCPEVEN